MLTRFVVYVTFVTLDTFNRRTLMKALNLRNIPEELHAALKIRALQTKKSLQDLAVEILQEAIEDVTMGKAIQKGSPDGKASKKEVMSVLEEDF